MDDSRRPATRLLLLFFHVFMILWTFLGAFVLPRAVLPVWIVQLGLTFIGWIYFKGKCWVTMAEHRASAGQNERYQSSTLKLIANLGVDVAKHKNGITFFIDTWHYVCLVVAFYRLGHVEYAAVFLGVWFVINRGYRNVWNY
jgi:hypothetical protein